MIGELLQAWFKSLLAGTFVGGVTGGFLALLIFAILAWLGLWNHSRLIGGWRIATLTLLGLFFAVIGILAGATWGICRAAEKKLLAAHLEEAPFLRQKLAPISAAGVQFIGSALTLAEHPEWLKDVATAKQLPAPALEAISSFQKGERQLDPEVLAKHLGSMSHAAIKKLFPLLEAQIASSHPEMLESPVYRRLRPYLLDLVIELLESKEKSSVGDGQDWLTGSLAQASRRDGQALLSRDELQAGIEKEGFHHLCCRPAAALIAVERCQICLFLAILLLLPPLIFLGLRRWLGPKPEEPVKS